MAPYVEDERPATLADIRSLRRWLAVAAVWAVAATALGVIALLKANEDDSADRTAAAGELGQVQRQLNSRIDDLESRIDELPTSDDVVEARRPAEERRGRAGQEHHRHRAPQRTGR